jgi:hypothetical protein
MKGRSKIYSVSNGERGVDATAICCVSAAACYVPPMLIYEWARGCDNFKDGALLGTVFAINPTSIYINKGLFLKWLTHFVETVKPNVSRKNCSALNDHYTRTKNVEALQFAHDRGVIMHLCQITQYIGCNDWMWLSLGL